MLNLIDIANRISNPTLIEREDINSLQQLCDTYPYSQVFPILYLKSLANSNDVRLDQELEKYAYRISDRRTLYYLIQEKESMNLQIEKESNVETRKFENSKVEDSPVNLDEPEDLNIYEPIQIVESPEREAEKTLNSDEEQDLKIEILEDSKVEEPVQIIESSNSETTASQANQIFEQSTNEAEKPSNSEALQSVNNDVFEIPSSYSLESDEKRLAEEKQRLIEALKSDPRLNDSVEESTFVQSVDIDSKKSFSSWLQANQSYEKVDEIKPSTDDLINKFIETSPKISSPKDKLFEDRTERTDFFSPTKKAKESLDEGQLPVSETLAKIFAAQGNYPKAIYAYEQLMLIIPEKKIFFANQISELQKKINLK